MAKMTERSRAMKINGTLMIIGLLFNMGALLLLWVDGARTPYVDKDFSYSADIITRNAEYDQKAKEFLNTSYNTAQFQLGATGNQNEIQRSYTEGDVKAIPSTRAIDAKNGTYTDKRADGEYVFAPREVSTNDTFFFTPLEGGEPVELRYNEIEVIKDVSLYHFRGERTLTARTGDVSLQANESIAAKTVYDVWVEPTSGWLVKYKSTTDTNVVTTGTEKIIRPLIQSSVITTPQSIDQHTAYANSLRAKRVFILQVGPTLFIISAVILIAGVFLVRTGRKKTLPVTLGMATVFVIASITLVGWLAGIPVIATFFVGQVATHPLVSMCFIILIGGIYARCHDKSTYMVLAGGVVLVTATTQLLGSLGVLPLRLEQLFFGMAVPASGSITTSMMSPYISLALVGFSTIFITRGIRKHPSLKYLQFVIAVTLMLGLLGVILNVTRINAAIAIPFAWSLSLPESIMLIVTAFTALQLFYRSVGVPEDIKSTLWSLRWASLASVPIVIIGIIAQMQQYSVSRDLSATFDTQIANINTGLGSRFQMYTQALYGARGLLLSSQEVTNEEWRDYNNAYHTADPLDGMEAIGYARVAGDTVTLEHVEPGDKSVPTNLDEDAVVRETVKRAIATGQVAISSPVPAPTPNDIRTYIMVPVYAKGSPIVTPTERQAHIEGIVFGAMSFPKVTHASTDGIAADVGFEIYAGSEVDGEPLFRRYEAMSSDVARLTKQQTLYTSGQAFTIVYHALPSFRLNVLQEYSATAILIGGSIVYWGVLAMIYILVDMNQLRGAKRTETTTRDR